MSQWIDPTHSLDKLEDLLLCMNNIYFDHKNIWKAGHVIVVPVD